MRKWFLSLVVLAMATLHAGAHFIWVVPAKSTTGKITARVVFSENLEPDDADLLPRIAGTQLFVRSGDGPARPVQWAVDGDAYKVELPDAKPAVVAGVCRYGVLKRGDAEGFLLVYYPKAILGGSDRGSVLSERPTDRLALELMPEQSGANSYLVLWQGKPLTGADVSVHLPGKKDIVECKTDERGVCKAEPSSPGLLGIRVRHIENRSGEHDGMKYQSVRHYATLVLETGTQNATDSAGSSDRKGGANSPAAYAPLPKAVSSLGAAVADGWLYVYGGHSGKTHQYSTETALGTFHRLNLAHPTRWEELPSGPAVQGLALVAHQGKIYRIGGMQPRNKPGEKADNVSLASCSCFDPSSKQWKDLPDMPEGRSSHDAAVVGDKLVVVGGWNMRGAGKPTDWHTTALVLDLKQTPLKWQPIKQPFERRALTASAHDGKVFVIGGLTEEGGITLEVREFDPTTGAWSKGALIPGPQSNGFTPASCDAGGKLYVSAADGKLYRLSPTGKGWEEAGVLQRPRFVHRMVAAGDNLLIAVGGASKQGNVDLTEALVPR